MATHVSETTSTTTTSEQEEEQQTFLQLLWEKIKSVFGLIRRIIKILIILTLVVTIIITVGTGLSTTEESVWQGSSPAGSELSAFSSPSAGMMVKSSVISERSSFLLGEPEPSTINTF